MCLLVHDGWMVGCRSEVVGVDDGDGGVEFRLLVHHGENWQASGGSFETSQPLLFLSCLPSISWLLGG